ncbi:MAG TPA: ATP-binding protein [Dermatophilaceae bacterium]|nr:ATP-binding protein [Dermatophilaceae bacterium]
MARPGVPLLALSIGTAAVAAKVVLSAPRLPLDAAEVAITWVSVTSFVVVGVALLLTRLPAANGWACLTVAWATVPGDLNTPHWAEVGQLSALGYAFELGYLPATVALVLRYPRDRLSAPQRRLVWALVVACIALRVPAMLTAGALADGFYRPDGWPSLGLPWWHDWVLHRGVVALRVVLLAATAAVLLRRAVTATGLARQSITPLAVIVAVCGAGAAVDQAVWLHLPVDLGAVHGATIRNVSAGLIPLALVADLLRRRVAAAAVVDRMLRTAASADLGATQQLMRQVVGDPSLALSWPGDRTPSPTDRQHQVEIRREDGRPLVTMTYDQRAVSDESVLLSAVSALRLGLENSRLTSDLLVKMTELDESRTRIVEAGMAERRRVERDLHDGAQQQLLAVAATLAKVDLVGDGDVRGVVREARGRLGDALTDLRRLARGIHPAALTQGGLPAALPALRATSSLPLDLDVDARLQQQRLAPALEGAIYFFVAEALANATKHAAATSATVTVGLDGDRVAVTVRDDGRGGASVVPGGGLAGLRDRVEALRGRLTLVSGGRGTTVTASFPVAFAEPTGEPA